MGLLQSAGSIAAGRNLPGSAVISIGLKPTFRSGLRRALVETAGHADRSLYAFLENKKRKKRVSQ
jgi:hypothetical protein